MSEEMTRSYAPPSRPVARTSPLDEAVVDATGAGAVEHFGGEVDAVDRGHPVAAQPRGGAAGAAAEVGGAADGGPSRGGEFVEEGEVHDVLDGLLVGLDPLSVAGGDVHRAVSARVEVGEVNHAPKYRRPPGRGATGFTPGAPRPAWRRPPRP